MQVTLHKLKTCIWMRMEGGAWVHILPEVTSPCRAEDTACGIRLETLVAKLGTSSSIGELGDTGD